MLKPAAKSAQPPRAKSGRKKSHRAKLVTKSRISTQSSSLTTLTPGDQALAAEVRVQIEQSLPSAFELVSIAARLANVPSIDEARARAICIMTTTIAGGCVAISVFGGGAWLVKNGASTIGAAAMIAALGSLIGTAI